MTAVPRVGRKLADRYRLVRALGRGGTGVVYLARDALRAQAGDDYPYVALKLLNDRWRGDAFARDVFRRQALRTCRVAVPSVVRTYDLGQDGGEPFATMEYVRGVDLRRAMRGGVSRERAWTWIGGVGRALLDMHGAGWIHADLKPSNVMIDTHGGIRLLDLGLVDPSARGSSALTPAYASRARRDGGEPSFRDDVHAFACVSYELLGGKRPLPDGDVERLPGLRGRAWRALRDALGRGPMDMADLLRALRLA